MKKKHLTLIVLLNCIINICSFAESIEVYNLFPIWQEKGKPSPFAYSIYSEYIDLMLGNNNSKKIKNNRDSTILSLIKRVENISFEKDGEIVVIGFYSFPEPNMVNIDIYHIEIKNLFVLECKSIIIDERELIHPEKIAADLFNDVLGKYDNALKRNWIFDYLLPYQAEYYALELKKKLKSNGKPPKRKNSYKFNGKIDLDDLFFEIKFALDGNESFYLKRVIEISYGDHLNDLKGRKANRRYRAFFAQAPCLWKYIQALHAFTIIQSSPKTIRPGVKNIKRDSFQTKLDDFLTFHDTFTINQNEMEIWNRQKLTINEYRNILVLNADAFLGCENYKKLSREEEKKGQITLALNYLYLVAKNCHDEDILNKIKKLLISRDSIFKSKMQRFQYLYQSNELEKAFETFKEASQIRAIEERDINKLGNMNNAYYNGEKISMTDFKLKMIEHSLNSIIYTAYKYKFIERKVRIRRNGQVVDILFEPSDSDSDLALRVSYYPSGKIDYKGESIEDNIIINSIYSILKILDTNTKPSIELFFTGSADLTGYVGFVLPNNNEFPMKENIEALECNANKAYLLSQIRDINASDYEKNLALAFMRAAHKRNSIMKKIKFVPKDNVCGVVDTNRGQKYRYVIITLRIHD